MNYLNKNVVIFQAIVDGYAAITRNIFFQIQAISSKEKERPTLKEQEDAYFDDSSFSSSTSAPLPTTTVVSLEEQRKLDNDQFWEEDMKRHKIDLSWIF